MLQLQLQFYNAIQQLVSYKQTFFTFHFYKLHTVNLNWPVHTSPSTRNPLTSHRKCNQGIHNVPQYVVTVFVLACTSLDYLVNEYKCSLSCGRTWKTSDRPLCLTSLSVWDYLFQYINNNQSSGEAGFRARNTPWMNGFLFNGRERGVMCCYCIASNML